MKGFLKGMSIILATAMICIALFGLELGGIHLNGFFRKEQKNIDREVFKSTVTYNEGKLDDLAKYKLEMIKEKDPIARAGIQSYINETYANFDENNIKNMELRQFLQECRNGAYSIEESEVHSITEGEQ